MDRFQRLAAFLESTIANPSSSPDLARLQLKLERCRPALLDFLDTPAKDQQQRQQLEKGTLLLLTF